MQPTLAHYLSAFAKLKRGTTSYGPAPHKPVLLLSVLQAFASGKLTENRITISADLIYMFKTNWTALVTSPHVCNFALPFFHLRGDKFWHLTPNPGFELPLLLKESMSSLGSANAAIAYVCLDQALYQLVVDPHTNSLLQQQLLTHYFAETRQAFSEIRYNQAAFMSHLQKKILHESAVDYRAEIQHLLKENNEEEIFIRSSIFKREIPRLYHHTCCISGLRVDASINISMIDACHIVPFSESYNDTITNGLAMCPNLHRAFDRGLITIDSDYKVVVSKHFKESDVDYSIGRLHGKKILLPSNPEYYPAKENLAAHNHRFAIHF